MGPKPDLEPVQVRDGQSSEIWSHGYRFQIVRRHLCLPLKLHLVTAMTRRLHVGDLLLTGPNLPHEGTGDVADGVSMTGRTLTPGLHEAEPSVAHTCHQAQAGFNNVPHLTPRVLAAKGMPPARVCSLHRSGARFAAAA